MVFEISREVVTITNPMTMANQDWLLIRYSDGSYNLSPYIEIKALEPTT